jgi:hypothetical protein
VEGKQRTNVRLWHLVAQCHCFMSDLFLGEHQVGSSMLYQVCPTQLAMDEIFTETHQTLHR